MKLIHKGRNNYGGDHHDYEQNWNYGIGSVTHSCPYDGRKFERRFAYCQRRRKNASVCRSKNISVMLARRPPNWGAFSSSIRLGWDYPPACPSWHGVSGAYI